MQTMIAILRGMRHCVHVARSLLEPQKAMRARAGKEQSTGKAYEVMSASFGGNGCDGDGDSRVHASV